MWIKKKRRIKKGLVWMNKNEQGGKGKKEKDRGGMEKGREVRTIQ
jgi:hypothetical protein